MPRLEVRPSVGVEVQLREVARAKGVRHDRQEVFQLKSRCSQRHVGYTMTSVLGR